jgi:hypothetical protein
MVFRGIGGNVNSVFRGGLSGTGVTPRTFLGGLDGQPAGITAGPACAGPKVCPE